MLNRTNLRHIARARLNDANALYRSKRYDGAIYLCGYAIEIILKEGICKTLRWPGFPSTRKEFENYSSFRTHDLDILLSLSGVEEKVKSKYFAEWSTVAQWNPESRYNPIGTTSGNDAMLMIESAKKLMRQL